MTHARAHRLIKLNQLHACPIDARAPFFASELDSLDSINAACKYGTFFNSEVISFATRNIFLLTEPMAATGPKPTRVVI